MPVLTPVLVAAALGLVGLAQAAALVRLPEPPAPVRLVAPPSGYVFTADGRVLAVSFQLRNEGRTTARVRSIGDDLPGLELVDVEGVGEPFGFTSRGGGEQGLPPFVLRPGQTAVITLTYRLTGCADVPGGPRPVPVLLRDSRVGVPLAQLPDDSASARPDDLVEWQAHLVRELCGPR